MKLIPAIVEWEDTVCDPGDLDAKKGKIKPRIMVACGWLIRNDNKHVVIGVDWDRSGKCWKSYQQIPKGMVRKVTLLKAY